MTEEQATSLLEAHFGDVESLLEAVYKNGGVQMNGYGFIKSGYGGGVEHDQAFGLTWLGGYLMGGANGDKDAIMEAINTLLLAHFSDEVNDGNVPFINLDEMAIGNSLANLPETLTDS